MPEYISREDYCEENCGKENREGYKTCTNCGMLNVPSAVVQLLSVVAEHIKKRLYETAFNTTEAEARNAIADMAERIDFWINELKEGGDSGEP